MHIIKTLSENTCISKDEYFKNIANNVIANTIKLADRIDNLRDMSCYIENGRIQKVKNKILETEAYLL